MGRTRLAAIPLPPILLAILLLVATLPRRTRPRRPMVQAIPQVTPLVILLTVAILLAPQLGVIPQIRLHPRRLSPRHRPPTTFSRRSLMR